MDGVLIDDRRIHVDFSQSVSRLHAEALNGRAQSFNTQSLGSGLERKQKYRDKKDSGKEHSFVFDEPSSNRRRPVDDRGRREKDRHRKEDEERSRDDRHRKDPRARSRDRSRDDWRYYQKSVGREDRSRDRRR
jgi:peptidyl-prolyl cis-trans isomerase-like 4